MHVAMISPALLADALGAAGVDVTRHPHRTDPDELTRAWKARRPDVVHAFSVDDALACLTAAQRLHDPVPTALLAERPPRLPIVLTVDGIQEFSTHRFGPAILRSVTALVTETEATANALITLGADRRTMSVIPAAIDSTRYSPTGPALPRGTTRRIVAVGDLTPTAGFDTAIAALPRLSATQLVIAGGPPRSELAQHPEARRLRAGAQALGVADRVGLLGDVPTETLPALLRSADVLVHVPFQDGSTTRIPLLAMACGVPVVVSQSSAAGEPVVDGVHGLLLPPRRPDLLGRALHGLLSDPFRLLGYGVAAADRARSRYGQERVAVETERLYRSLCPAEETTDEALDETPVTTAPGAA